MSEVKISEKYIDKVLSPMRKSGKIVPSILMFKDDSKEEVVINTSDASGTCWVGIKTGQDNIAFEGDCVGILDLGNFVKYIDLVDYGSNESAYLNRIEAKTRRGSRMDCLELGGSIGKFTMPLAREESFEDKNRKIQKDREEATDNDSVERIATFKLSKEDLKSVADIGKGLDVTKVTISIGNDDIKLFLKGKANNQYTKVIDSDSFRLETLDFEDGTTGTFTEDEEYEEYLPFMYQIFDLANTFGEDFVFDIRRNSGVYSLQAYGTSKDEEGNSTDIRYVMITAFSPENVLSGNTEVDVFEFTT